MLNSWRFWRFVFTKLSIAIVLVVFTCIIFSALISTIQTIETCPDWFLEHKNLAQDDPKLLSYIYKYHLEPPSSKPYQRKINGLKNPSAIGSAILTIFQGKKNGIFIEAGAFDGIQESNTLILERDFGWSGILIEGNSFLLSQLRLAYRKAWIADVCLTMTSYPQKIKFIHHPGETSAGMIQYSSIGKNPSNDILKQFNEDRKDAFISAGYVECFPLFSIIAALGITKIDYCSLDIEGAELKVLENIPFHQIDIKVFSVEHWIVDGGSEAITAFLSTKNYTRVAKKSSDSIFVKNELLKDLVLDENNTLIETIY